MKTTRVTCRLPVSVRQTHRVTKRVYLPFPFAQLRTNRWLVINTPGTGLRAKTERVRIPVDQNAERLAVDHSGDQVFQLSVGARQCQVGHDLRARIAQPHRVDVAGDY